MSLVKPCFENWLVSIQEQGFNFSRSVKKSNHSKHMKGFYITRSSNIFSIKSDKFWLKDLLTTPIWKLLTTILINYKVSPLWRNLGSNNDLTENQNKFQFPARNVLGKSSVNIKFWGATFPSLLVTHWNTLISHHWL